MSLDAPLPGENAATALPAPATAEAEGEAFMAAMQAMNVQGGA